MMMTTTKKRIWKNNILSYVPPKISFVKSLPGETKDQEKKMVSIDQSNIREKKEQHKTPSLFGQTRSPDLSQ
jgi:hypothetical protein